MAERHIGEAVRRVAQQIAAADLNAAWGRVQQDPVDEAALREAVLRDAHAAEDVVSAGFAVLIRHRSKPPTAEDALRYLWKTVARSARRARWRAARRAGHEQPGIPVAAPPPTTPGNPGGTAGIVGTYRGVYNTTVKGENGAPFPGRVSGTLTVTITATEPHPAGGLRLSGTVSYTDFPDGPRTRPIDPAYSRFMPATGAVEILADDAPDGHSGGTGSVRIAGILNGDQIPIDTGGASFGIRSDPWSTALHEAFVLTRV
jgi:hypothetical protein